MNASSMTGTFKMSLPADLMSAVEKAPAQTRSLNMEIDAMEPSLFERMLGWFARR